MRLMFLRGYNCGFEEIAAQTVHKCFSYSFVWGTNRLSSEIIPYVLHFLCNYKTIAQTNRRHCQMKSIFKVRGLNVDPRTICMPKEQSRGTKIRLAEPLTDRKVETERNKNIWLGLQMKNRYILKTQNTYNYRLTQDNHRQQESLWKGRTRCALRVVRKVL